MARRDDQLPRARLVGIYRYPIKGLPGQPLGATSVRRGTGLPGDRRYAITSGRTRPPEDGRWQARQAFLHLAKDLELALIDIGFDGDRLCLNDPVHGPVSIPLDDLGSAARADTLLSRWFPEGRGPAARLVRADHGYWDAPDATLSIVNLSTLSELSTRAGRHLDPRRFRANLYLDGLAAWEEFTLVGRRLRVGEAELEIIRPINRCRATSVDPGTGEADVNVPAVLGATYGHVACGVYARVHKAGTFAPGQRVFDVTGGEPGRTAQPITGPRLVKVVDRVRESENVASLWMRDHSLAAGDCPPGTHIRIHAVDRHGPVWRSYTVSAIERGALRVSVRREDEGRMSRLLHDTVPGTRLLISGPYGEDVRPDDGNRPILLASAGIGITPMIAMLRSLGRRRLTAPLLLCHTTRDASELALWEEARSLVARLPAAHASLHLSRPRPGECERFDATPGRPDLPEAARAYFRPDEAETFLCGPAGYLEQQGAALLAAGLPESRLHYEVFASPRQGAGARNPAPEAGPFEVRFAKSDVTARWTPEAGSLLDLGESAGLTLPAGCREGACHRCRQRIVSGRVANTVEPTLDPPAGSALLCCAVPISDLTVNA